MILFIYVGVWSIDLFQVMWLIICLSGTKVISLVLYLYVVSATQVVKWNLALVSTVQHRQYAVECVHCQTFVFPLGT